MGLQRNSRKRVVKMHVFMLKIIPSSWYLAALAPKQQNCVLLASDVNSSQSSLFPADNYGPCRFNALRRTYEAQGR